MASFSFQLLDSFTPRLFVLVLCLHRIGGFVISNFGVTLTAVFAVRNNIFGGCRRHLPFDVSEIRGSEPRLCIRDNLQNPRSAKPQTPQSGGLTRQPGSICASRCAFAVIFEFVLSSFFRQFY